MAAAVEVEIEVYMAQFAALLTMEGHAVVVRKGRHPERHIDERAGPMTQDSVLMR